MVMAPASFILCNVGPSPSAEPADGTEASARLKTATTPENFTMTDSPLYQRQPAAGAST
jgi:hypothetical protein